MRAFLALLLALSAWQAAASPALPPGSLRFRHLNATHKQQMEFVWNIVQDRQGFVWIAGQNGVHRFDGHRVRSFYARDGDPSRLAHNTVRRMYVDPAGTLWLGTRAGLQHYDPASETFVLHRPKDVATASLGLYARAIETDGKGGLWLGTAEGLQHFVPGPGGERFDSIALDGGGAAIIDIATDRRGRLWIARTNDLVRYDPAGGAVRRFAMNRCHSPKAGEKATQSRKLLIDGDLLWFATTTGLERLDTRADDAPCTDLGKAAHLAGQHVVTMLRDRENDIWLSVDGAGLMRWRRADGGTDAFGHSGDDPYSIGGNMIQALAQDRSGTLWVGTLDAGVDYADLASGGFRRLLRTEPPNNGLSSNRIVNIGELKDGRVWIGTLDAGVNFYDPASGAIATLQALPREMVARLNNGGVYGLAQDRENTLWVTTELGLHRYDARRKRFDGPRLLADASFGTYIFSLHADDDGKLWGTSRDGVRRFDPATGAITAFRHDPARPDTLSGNRVGKLMRDREGMEWAVTAGGVDVLDPASGKVRRISHPRLADSVSHLYENGRGDVWIGLSSGLLHVRRSDFATEYHPLPVEAASVLEADDGRLWIGTDVGLAVYDPRTRKLTRYAAADGTADGSFRPDSALRTADGTMYFGSFRGGVTVFHPRDVRRNAVAPAVAITGIAVDNRPLLPGAPPEGVRLDTAPQRTLTLPHREGTFAIEFSAMHYGDPERNVYAYRMAGHDDKWTRTDAGKPFALYGSLPPGDYRFEVMAANQHGVWSAAPAELRITVTPALWETAWFRALAALLALTLLWLAYRVRVRLLLRKQAQLETVVAQRTAQVRAAQEQLVFREKMASVGTLTAGIAHEINNPANFAHVGAQLLGKDLEQFRALLRELAGEDADAEVMRTIEEQFDTLFERIGTIADGTTRIRDLVKDLRTFARLDEAEKKEVDLIQSLRSTIRLVHPQYLHTVEFVTDFAAHPRLECWPAQLNQVFMNVIVNACQAIETRRREDAAAPPGRLVMRSREEPGWCVLEFEDNGCGIAPGVLERIFEPFFTTKDAGSGTGLGLSISFGIVERHRGTIAARSTQGQGTCFTIRLPMAAATEPAAAT